MNDKYSTTEGKTSEKLSDEAMLSAQWKNIDWHKAEREVNRLQIRIVKATQQKDYNAVKRLQYLLTHSFYAKALAVKRVVTNDGRKTPGVDGVLWNTPAKKMKAVLSLTDKGYRARPLRRVYIEKKDKKKKRPLGIPTMYDRAMQALYALALEPVAETTADGKSFGFRKGRCAQDACEYLFNALSRKHISPKWVLEGDIKGCFDHISHQWLLDYIPMDKVMLRKWLESGFVFNRQLFPTEEGAPQGGIISPTLANMTLDGLQMLAENFKLRRTKMGYFNPMVNLVRYADDFIITCSDREILESQIKPAVSEFLQARGLTLSEEKTKITHIDEGFDFLGFNIRKYKGTLLIKPSKKNVKEFLAKIKSIVRKNQAIRQDKLIGLLNPVITGWGNYYKGCVAAKTFKNADAQIFYKLWAWALRRHRHKGKKWVYNRYFLSKKGRAWTFGTMLKNNGKPFPYTLKYLSDIDTKTKPIKIRSKANPFDPEWRPYFEMRNRMKMLSSLKGKQGFLRMWEKQNQRCPLCGEIIDADKIWTIAELSDKSGKSKIIAHDRCSRTLTRKIRAYEPVS